MPEEERGDLIKLRQRLRSRYGDTQTAAMAGLKFSQLRQEMREGFPEFALRIEALSLKAYPAVAEMARQTIVVGQFVNGLRDHEILRSLQLSRSPETSPRRWHEQAS